MKFFNHLILHINCALGGGPLPHVSAASQIGTESIKPTARHIFWTMPGIFLPGRALVVRDMGACVDGLVRRDGQHLAHMMRASANPLRQRPLLLMMISIVGMVISSIDARVDCFLFWDRNKMPGCVCDHVHCGGLCVMGCMVLLPIRIRVIGIEGIVRGDREHLAEMADPCPVADPWTRNGRASTHVQKKSGNVQKMCRTVGAMLSVPICEAAETCGNGPRRGH